MSRRSRSSYKGGRPNGGNTSIPLRLLDELSYQMTPEASSAIRAGANALPHDIMTIDESAKQKMRAKLQQYKRPVPKASQAYNRAWDTAGRTTTDKNVMAMPRISQDKSFFSRSQAQRSKFRNMEMALESAHDNMVGRLMGKSSGNHASAPSLYQPKPSVRRRKGLFNDVPVIPSSSSHNLPPESNPRSSSRSSSASSSRSRGGSAGKAKSRGLDLSAGGLHVNQVLAKPKELKRMDAPTFAGEILSEGRNANNNNSFAQPARDDVQSLAIFHTNLMNEYRKGLNYRGSISEIISESMKCLSSQPLLDILEPQIKIIELTMSSLCRLIEGKFSDQGILLGKLFGQYKSIVEVLLSFLHLAVGFTEKPKEEVVAKSRIVLSQTKNALKNARANKEKAELPLPEDATVKYLEQLDEVEDDEGSDAENQLNEVLQGHIDKGDLDRRFLHQTQGYKNRVKEREVAFNGALKTLIKYHQLQAQILFVSESVPLVMHEQPDVSIDQYEKQLKDDINSLKLLLDPLIGVNSGNTFLTATEQEMYSTRTTGQRKVLQLELVDHFLGAYKHRYAQAVGEKRGMQKMVTSCQSAIKSLERRGAENQKVFHSILKQHKRDYEAERDAKVALELKIEQLEKARALDKIAKDKVVGDLEMLTFTVQQMQRTYKGAMEFSKEPVKVEMRSVEVQWVCTRACVSVSLVCLYCYCVWIGCLFKFMHTTHYATFVGRGHGD
jgi:hypothetical protein